jgi:hypothetical protein
VSESAAVLCTFPMSKSWFFPSRAISCPGLILWLVGVELSGRREPQGEGGETDEGVVMWDQFWRRIFWAA